MAVNPAQRQMVRVVVPLVLLVLLGAVTWSALATAPWERDVWDGCWKAKQEWERFANSVSDVNEARIAFPFLAKASDQIMRACYGGSASAPSPVPAQPIQLQPMSPAQLQPLRPAQLRPAQLKPAQLRPFAPAGAP